MAFELQRGTIGLVRVTKSVRPPPAGLDPFGGTQQEFARAVLTGPDEDKAAVAELLPLLFETEAEFDGALRRLTTTTSPTLPRADIPDSA